MKKIIPMFILIAGLLPLYALQYSDQEMLDIIQDWEQSIDAIEIKYEERSLKILGEALRKLSRPTNQYSEKWQELFEKSQNKMVKIPNHAQYFRDQINAMFDPVTKKLTNESGNNQRYLIRETLCHIPSPEMVQLLGEMLEDERGKRPDPNDRLGATSNADHACSALMLIGLDNMPVPRGTGLLPVESAYKRKDTWKLWWGPIQAGNKSFSFVGQDVEYRFRKDGTYETLPKNGAATKISSNATDDAATAPTKMGKPSPRWLILLGGSAALFAWLRWQAKRMTT